MKKSMLFILFVLLASVVLMAAAPVGTVLARLEIINKTGDDINVKMMDETGEVFYYLNAPADETTEFTVQREKYDVTVWACSNSASASLDMATNVRLNFPSCSATLNSGEPTMEKVVLRDYTEGGSYWRFHY